MRERDRFCTSARDLWDENIFQEQEDGKLLSNQNLMRTDLTDCPAYLSKTKLNGLGYRIFVLLQSEAKSVQVTA